MAVEVCSLKVETNQLVPPNTWYLVRFPFDTESTDPLDMHSDSRPPPGGPILEWSTDERSSLIWPSRSGWGDLFALIQWEAAGAQSGCSDGTEYRDQFIRDPLGYTTTNPMDTTATHHRAATIGGQYIEKSWGIFVNPDVPLALRVRHNCSDPLNLALAEFKLAINF